MKVRTSPKSDSDDAALLEPSGELAAGNRHTELVVGRSADREAVVVRGVEALEREHLAVPLEVLVGERLCECDVRGLHRAPELLGGRIADLDRHEIRSSGA